MEFFIPIGMRAKTPTDGLVVNTCSGNDSCERGDLVNWTWSNPTNRRFAAVHPNDPECVAVSVECLWQGTKLFDPEKRDWKGCLLRGRDTGLRPDEVTLAGDWRRGKKKRPVGAWDGPDNPILTTPGAARRAIYIPAYRWQIESWLADQEVAEIVARARTHSRVYLRDHDTGQGVDRHAPMSHGWLLSVYMNKGTMPE
jgi:hypothetical protein